MENKEHLTQEGLKKIKKISNNMNTGRSFEDKYNYLKFFLRLDSNGHVNYKLPEHWVQTFIDGEGMFYNYISPLQGNGKEVIKFNKITLNSSLEIAQRNHDVLILLAIKQFFNGGYLKPKYNINSISECEHSRSVNRFIFRDTKKIIEFVDKYPMLTRKQLDYIDWRTIVELKINGAHKTSEGLIRIKQIKAKMNSNRD
jgi:hypothetical protein